MSRRTNTDIADIAEKNGFMYINVPAYSVSAAHLQNQTGGYSYRPTGNIQTYTTNGISGITSKGLSAASPYWLNSKSQTITQATTIIPGDKPYTFAFYIYHRGARGHGWCFDLIDRNGTPLDGYTLATSYTGNASKFKPFWNSTYSMATPTRNVWVHVAISVNLSGEGLVYYNGTLMAETVLPYSDIKAYGIALRGGTTDGGNTSNAVFRQIKYYNNMALKDTEIKALFNQELRTLIEHPLQ